MHTTARIGTSAAALLALLATACGSERSGEITTADGETAQYTIDQDTGETSMTIKGEDGDSTLRAGATVPVSLPAGFTLLSGSKVVSNAVVNQPGGSGTMVTFEADAPAEAVIAHYRDAAKAAGFAIQMEMNTNGTQMVAAERAGDGSSMSVTATAGEPTTGQLIIGSETGG